MNEIVHINIRYSGLKLNWRAKKYTKVFFKEPEFRNRNNVFVSSMDDFILSLEKNSIHITMQNDPAKLRYINVYLRNIFLYNYIHVDAPAEVAETVLKFLNY